MSEWPATKSRRVFAALLRLGWQVKRETGGSHRIPSRPGWPDVVFAVHDHDRDDTGPRMLSRIGKTTGLRPDDL